MIICYDNKIINTDVLQIIQIDDTHNEVIKKGNKYERF